MNSKHLVIVGCCYVPLAFAISVFFLNLTMLETKSQAEPLQMPEHMEGVVPYDKTIRSGILGPDQTISKSITLDHTSMFVLDGQFTIDFQGPSEIKYWIETPSGQISHESPSISSESSTTTYEIRTINIEIGDYKVWFHNEGPGNAEVTFDYVSHVEVIGCGTD